MDKTNGANEAPDELARRLAQTKALAIARLHPQAIVIAGDQVGTCNGQRLHKPGSHEKAIEQLQSCSGETASFYSGLAVWDPSAEVTYTDVIATHVSFRRLSTDQVHAYVTREQPLDCAGSFMIEKLGIALFERVEADDPSALVGLPLIRLVDFLGRCGVDVLQT